MKGTDAPNPLARLEILASALSGRTLCVTAATPGEPGWTDTRTIFIDETVDPAGRLVQLATQASLLAAGSLEPEVVRRLSSRPAVLRRYLAVEGHRALAFNEEWLPPAVITVIDHDLTARSDSPGASIRLAHTREEIPAAPPEFGAIRPRRIPAGAASRTEGGAGGKHIPRKRTPGALKEVDEDGSDEEGYDDNFTSPVGGGGAIGKLLARLLGASRGEAGQGQPGADAPTHRTRSGVRGGNAVVSQARSAGGEDPQRSRGGVTYPEWDVNRRTYRADWCTVQEMPAPPGPASAGTADDLGLRKPLARLGLGLQRTRRQAQGDDIDSDAVVAAQVEALAGNSPDEAIYIDSLRRRRELGVVVLLDVSGSTAEPGTAGKTVHEQQRAVAAALTTALHGLGDRVALYAFASQGRSAVNVTPVKRFDEHVDSRVMRRLHGLKPGAYSRLGAAIRHGAAIAERDAGTPRRLLVVLSDGLAYDHGYERTYGAADARRALAETRRSGTGCLALTIGAGTDAGALRHVFGSASHATIPRPDQLKDVVGPLFRSAIRAGEARRRLAQSPHLGHLPSRPDGKRSA